MIIYLKTLLLAPISLVTGSSGETCAQQTASIHAHSNLKDLLKTAWGTGIPSKVEDGKLLEFCMFVDHRWCNVECYTDGAQGGNAKENVEGVVGCDFESSLPNFTLLKEACEGAGGYLLWKTAFIGCDVVVNNPPWNTPVTYNYAGPACLGGSCAPDTITKEDLKDYAAEVAATMNRLYTTHRNCQMSTVSAATFSYSFLVGVAGAIIVTIFLLR